MFSVSLLFVYIKYKKLIRRWDNERELYSRHRARSTKYSCINSTTDRRGYVLEHRFTKFSEITQCNGHYAVQGHRFWYQFESSYMTSYILVINTNLPPIVSKLWLIIGQIFTSERRVPHFNALAGSDPLPISP